ncbi:MAG: HNH endonuclease signature motif containing protein [Aquabacterium commune]|uniref:HNH endonuclease signature motif containing protein n=1 Tax=Aquabacterium commune TaxID=70586 RepID=UPI003BB12B07
MTRQAKTIEQALSEGMAKALEVGECLEWQGLFGCKGVMPIIKSRELSAYTQNYAAPRLVWERENGPVPEGKLVYRSCCNNACVSLDHLVVGTRAQWAAARRKAGVTKHMQSTVAAITVARRKQAKYSREQVDSVRDLTRDGVCISDIVSATGVGRAMVQDIRQGRAWVSVGRGVFAGLVR